MAVVVAVVLVLGGGRRGGRCVAAEGAADCTPDTDIQKHEEIIHSEEINSAKEYVPKYMYVMPMPGFEGVRVEVTSNNGIFQAWFPFMDDCRIDSWGDKWWQVLVEVRKTNTALTVTLALDICQLSCELTTDATHKSGRDLKLQNLKLYGRGASKWKEQRPHPSCKTVNHSTGVPLQNLRSCTNPPPISTISPPHLNTAQQVVSVVVPVVVVVGIVM